MSEFYKFPKIPRLNREIIITEKIDGTNAQIDIAQWGIGAPGAGEREGQSLCVFVGGEHPAYKFTVGSRNRWITPESDNHGFATWAFKNSEAIIMALGEGRHFGEWWGKGIQDTYKGVEGKRFSLFNVSRWRELNVNIDGVRVNSVPVLYEGPWFFPPVGATTGEKLLWAPDVYVETLRNYGSVAAPGCKAEGIVVFHVAGNLSFKVTLENDEQHKGKVEES